MQNFIQQSTRCVRTRVQGTDDSDIFILTADYEIALCDPRYLLSGPVRGNWTVSVGNGEWGQV